MYGVIDDYGATAAPTDVVGAGAMQAVTAMPNPTAGTGGFYNTEPSGLDNTGYTRIATGYALDAPVGRSQTTWKSLFDFQHNPTFWVLAFLLAAVGLVHARFALGGQVGPAHAGLAAGI